MRVLEDSQTDAIMRFNDPISPDVDNMSYEQLLALGDVAGKVSKGLTKQQIDKIKSVIYVAGKTDTDTCTICMDNYVKGTKLKVLPCKHEYHSECVNEWLASSKKCPVCSQDV